MSRSLLVVAGALGWVPALATCTPEATPDTADASDATSPGCCDTADGGEEGADGATSDGATSDALADWAADDSRAESAEGDAATAGPATQISVGTATCARLRDGTARCWGFNLNGELGDGTTTTRLVPTRVKDLLGVQEIRAGGGHTCARLGDGSVMCWGLNLEGELGHPSTSRCGPEGKSPCSITPETVPGLMRVRQIALGDDTTCALLEDSSVKCWGWNRFGQIGDGTTESRWTPTTEHGRVDR